MAKGLIKGTKESNTPKPKKVTPVEQLIPEDKDTSKNNDSGKEQVNNDNQTQQNPEVVESKEEIVPNVSGEQVQVQSLTVIQSPKQITKFKVKKKHNEKRLISDLEQDYYNRLDEIRNKIDNPSPINRLNKRRKYSEDTRRNVTFSIREDIAILLDDLVDDAKIFKGKFNDEVMLLGIRTYLQMNGIGK